MIEWCKNASETQMGFAIMGVIFFLMFCAIIYHKCCEKDD